MKTTKDTDPVIRKKLRKRIRLVVVDENKMHRILNRRLPWWRLVAWIIIGIVSLGFAGVLIIVNTPLKSFLPGYLYAYEREDVMSAAMQLDSLNSEVSVRNMYVDNILNILNGNIDTVIPDVVDTTRVTVSIDSIITASEIERDYVKQYEDNQKFNVSVLSNLAAQGMTFINPFQGAEARLPEEGEDERRVTFDLPLLQPVSAVYRGTVMDVYNTMDNGYTVIIQHPNDFISRYSGLTQLGVSRGETTMPGMRIGMIDRDKTDKLSITPSFELWYRGAAVQPRDYIPF